MTLRKNINRRRRRSHRSAPQLESLESRRLLSAPNGPYGLAANVTSPTQVQLLFYDNASDETGFIVQRAGAPAGPFTTLEQLPANPGFGNTVLTVDDTVQSGHTYFYQVYAVTGDIGSSIAGPVGITIPTQITNGAGGSVQPVSMPNGPYGLRVDGLASTSVQLSFIDNADNEAGFVLERSPAGANAFAAIATIALSPGVGQRVSTTDTTAQPGTSYDYRVYAINGPYQSSIAGPVSATTTGTPPAPDSPFVTSADVVGSQGVVPVAVLFNDNSSNETGFSIQRSTNPDGPFAEVGTLPPGVGLAGFHQVFYDTSVNFATTYYYRVLAFNGPSFSFPSNVKSATTPGTQPNPGSAPNGPYGLAAIPNAQGQPQLLFYDNADNETGFVLQRADAAAGPFNTIQNLFPSPGVGQLYTITDTTAVAGQAYYYRVFAVNGPYQSSIAGPITIAASAGGGSSSIGSVQPVSMPNGPYGLRIESAAANAVQISFINNAANAAGFLVERSPAGANTFAVISATASSATVGQRVFYTDTTVQPNTAYDYRVSAVNGPYQSSIAGPVSVTTPAVPTSNDSTDGVSGYLALGNWNQATNRGILNIGGYSNQLTQIDNSFPTIGFGNTLNTKGIYSGAVVGAGVTGNFGSGSVIIANGGIDRTSLLRLGGAGIRTFDPTTLNNSSSYVSSGNFALGAFNNASFTGSGYQALNVNPASGAILTLASGIARLPNSGALTPNSQSGMLTSSGTIALTITRLMADGTIVRAAASPIPALAVVAPAPPADDTTTQADAPMATPSV
jgi:hypothetical protein